MKPTRLVDEKLLDIVRKLPCMACSSSDPRGALEAAHERDRTISHPHHVISRGAGGDDVATNVIALCGEHHREIHQHGNAHMRAKYPCVNAWFQAAEDSLDNPDMSDLNSRRSSEAERLGEESAPQGGRPFDSVRRHRKGTP